MNKRKTLRWIFGITGGLLILAAFLVIAFQTPDIPVNRLKTIYGGKKSRYIPINGMSVHFRDEGPAVDSTPLVLLHGSGSSLHTWDSLVASMPDKRCIRLDLPGFGLTGPNPTRDYSPGAAGEVLDSLLRFLQVDSCIIAGNSMGGLVAWSYASGHPGVKGLVLLDAAGFPQDRKGGNLGFTLARTPVVNRLVKYITPRSIVEKSLKQSYGNTALVTDALVQRYYDLNLREGNRQALIDRFTGPFSADTNRLANLTIPVLIIWGELDQVIPLEYSDRFMRLIPHAKKVVYKGIGHVPMEESPARVVASIRSWLVEARP
jgi:pimeloyl-ACP methyl ester carboxylesterase